MAHDEGYFSPVQDLQVTTGSLFIHDPAGLFILGSMDHVSVNVLKIKVKFWVLAYI